jgi:hypothetical protein
VSRTRPLRGYQCNKDAAGRPLPAQPVLEHTRRTDAPGEGAQRVGLPRRAHGESQHPFLGTQPTAGPESMDFSQNVGDTPIFRTNALVRALALP